MDTMMYQPKDYGPAIYLALNHAAGGLEIFDYFYFEEMDIWHIEVNEHGMHEVVTIEGSYVQSCHKAVKRGVKSWV